MYERLWEILSGKETDTVSLSSSASPGPSTMRPSVRHLGLLSLLIASLTADGRLSAQEAPGAAVEAEIMPSTPC